MLIVVELVIYTDFRVLCYTQDAFYLCLSWDLGPTVHNIYIKGFNVKYNWFNVDKEEILVETR
jgi:hypothetical protein